MRTRLAAMLGILLLAGVLLATFLPTSPAGATCGTWVAPEWSSTETWSIIDRATDTARRAEEAGRDDIASQARGVALGAVHSSSVCSSALSGRRTISVILLGFAVLVPIAVLFVGGIYDKPDISTSAAL